MKRIVIYPKDIMVITGRSERYSREILKKIRSRYEKEKHQVVSIDEFCTYMGINVDEFERRITA
jgi:hypothetical protein